LLLDKDIYISNDNNSLFLNACYYGYNEILILLLSDHRINIESNADWGLRQAAVYGRNADVVNTLLKDKRVNPCHNENQAIIDAYQYDIAFNNSDNIVKILWKDKRIQQSLSNNNKEIYDLFMAKYLKNKECLIICI
jgi:hypothetical protein